MTHPTLGEIRPNAATPAAVPFDFSSPVVQLMPELWEIAILAEYLHACLIRLGD